MSWAYLGENTLLRGATPAWIPPQTACRPIVIYIKLPVRATAYVEQVEVAGHIIALQEDRFRLLTETGQVYLLTLASLAGGVATEIRENVQ